LAFLDAGAIVTAVRTSSCRFKFLGIVGVLAIGLLSACGERIPSQAPLGSATQSPAKASSTTQCFFVVGPLSDNDAQLFAASGAGDVSRIEQSIAAGGNVNATDALKRTALFAAAFCNHPQAVNLLIDKGSDIDARDFLGMSPLEAAVVIGWEEAAKALIARGADINIRNTAGRTPLHMAAAANEVAMVELLLERGANVRLRDKDGNSAASLAKFNGHASTAATIKNWQVKEQRSSGK